LLENQLPFFIIKEIYNLAFPSRSNYHSFIQLTCELFEKSVRHCFSLQNEHHMPIYPNFKIMHFADLLKTFSLPQSKRLEKKKKKKKPVKDVIHHLYTESVE
jgi:hypothetical protein